MDVTFETSKGKQFTMEIWFFTSVLEMKELIEKHEGYPISSQTLVFNGQVMKDDGDTELYEILHGSTIQVKLEPDPELPEDVKEKEKDRPPVKDEEPTRVVLSINVPTSKKRFPLEVDVMDNVGRIKEMTQEQVGVPLNRYSLYFGSCEMQEDHVLANYGVVDGSEVNVVVRPFATPTPHNAEKKKMKVMVLPKCGTKKIAVEVNPFDNVSELRKELQRLHGQFHLPTEGYFFIFKQNVMDDDRTFRWHDVRPGDTIEIFNGSVSGGGS